MKYAITGHTSGIGLCVFNKLTPCVVGFSRTNGYDITAKKDIIRILEESDKCDVFINNAYADFGQSNLLLEAFKKWKDTEKTIINVGSHIAENNVNLKFLRSTDLLEYQMHKTSLKRLCEDLNAYGAQIKIKYVSFSYVKTDKIISKYPNMPSHKFISVNDAADQIINSYKENSNGKN